MEELAVRTCLLGLVTLLVAVLGPVAVAAEPVGAATVVSLSGQPARADTETTLATAVTTGDGAPVVGALVRVERRVAGAWQPLGQVVTDEQGRASLPMTMRRVPDDNVVRARYDGDTTYAGSSSGSVSVPLVRRASVLTLRGPDAVVDERALTLTVRWRTPSGEAVPGQVRLQRRAGARWRTLDRARTGHDGIVEVSLRPRRDVVLRAVAARLPWVEGDRSPRHRVDNLPPAPPVRLPRAAPRPRINLPDQPRAVGAGANVVVTRVPDGVWRSMVGRTWHRGCPVGREGLRLVRANYVDYSGYRRRGELVVARGATGQFAGALRAFHDRQVPMRSMYRVDRFGWSDRLDGGDDHRSMAAGNTSAFNCRDVVGRPGVTSPHSYGRSFDINPWENPYRASYGWEPNGWWVGRSHSRVAWRSHRHLVVQVLRNHGFAWTYGSRDAHHFDARTSSGRVLARCAGGPCH